jgi:hypothetical protein
VAPHTLPALDHRREPESDREMIFLPILVPVDDVSEGDRLAGIELGGWTIQAGVSLTLRSTGAFNLRCLGFGMFACRLVLCLC